MSSPRSTDSRTIEPGLPPAPVLHVHDLSVSYRTRRRTVEAVSGVSLAVAPGAVTALVGESGSGKSTTAQAAIGLLAPNARITGGSITLGGPDATSPDVDRTELVGLTERRWRGLRGPRIGLIPQDPASSLNPVRTVEQSVGEPLQIHGKGPRGHGKWGREALHAKVVELLDRVGLDDPETRARQYPHELSGGMRQRVLIAAALALQPDLLIADEPTSALDVTVQRTVLDLIDELRVSTGAGVLLITHDLAVASDRADELVVLQAGRVREAGPTGDVLDAPSAAYTRSLLADAPSLGRVVQRRRPTGATSFGSAIGDPDVPAPAQSPAGAPDTTDTAGTAVTVGDAGAPSTAGTPTASPSGAAPLVTVTDLRQEFPRPGASTPTVAVDGVGFEVAPGTTHALVGESGSGKTTTGRAIAGFRAPTAGRIEVAGTEVTALKGSAAVRGLRRSVQLVHQNPFGSLDPRQPVSRILEEPLRNFDLGSRAERARTVAHHLDLVSLAPELGDRRPRELSGGQRQRVAIARALILQPDLVVLDEAVSALDVTVQAQILRLLARLQEELGLTYVFISHDLAVVRQIADTVSVLQRGVQVEQGTVESVFEAPQHPYTRQLLEAIPGTVRPHSHHPSTTQKESHA